MKFKMSLMSTLVVALFGAYAAMAQPAFAKTREEVKAECAQAKKEGKELHGECDVAAEKAQTKSTKTRAAVKAEAKAAPKTPGETAANPKSDTTKSAKTRAEVKAECEMAKKEGKAVPPGECQ
ncbi:MAG: hypothetical protein ABT20_14100 [Rubrivivax sp. SCN 70-15]|nr:MAG: hypothetical protein ABT20_14100 [Rubrivivax sp. SCN 70-15]